MQKSLMIILTLILSINVAIANECTDLFAKGTAANKDGAAAFTKAQKTLKKAVKYYEAGNKKKGCKVLAASMKQAAASLKKFKGCKAAFAKAVDACDSQNADVAQGNVRSCEESAASVVGAIDYLKKVNAQYCKK